MSRSAERATPILFSSCSSWLLRTSASSSCSMTRRLLMVSRARSRRRRRRVGGDGLDQDVVQEGEAAHDLVASPASATPTSSGAAAAAGADPGLERGPLGVEVRGVGQDERARACPSSAAWQRGEGVDLLERDPRREVTGDEVAASCPRRECSPCVPREDRLRVAQSPRSRAQAGRGGRARSSAGSVRRARRARLSGVEAVGDADGDDAPAARPVRTSTAESPDHHRLPGRRPRLLHQPEQARPGRASARGTSPAP